MKWLVKWLRKTWWKWTINRHECIFCSRRATVRMKWSTDFGRWQRGYACFTHKDNLSTHVKFMAEVD